MAAYRLLTLFTFLATAISGFEGVFASHKTSPWLKVRRAFARNRPGTAAGDMMTNISVRGVQIDKLPQVVESRQRDNRYGDMTVDDAAAEKTFKEIEKRSKFITRLTSVKYVRKGLIFRKSFIDLTPWEEWQRNFSRDVDVVSPGAYSECIVHADVKMKCSSKESLCQDKLSVYLNEGESDEIATWKRAEAGEFDSVELRREASPLWICSESKVLRTYLDKSNKSSVVVHNPTRPDPSIKGASQGIQLSVEPSGSAALMSAIVRTTNDGELSKTLKNDVSNLKELMEVFGHKFGIIRLKITLSNAMGESTSVRRNIFGLIDKRAVPGYRLLWDVEVRKELSLSSFGPHSVRITPRLVTDSAMEREKAAADSAQTKIDGDPTSPKRGDFLMLGWKIPRSPWPESLLRTLTTKNENPLIDHKIGNSVYRSFVQWGTYEVYDELAGLNMPAGAWIKYRGPQLTIEKDEDAPQWSQVAVGTAKGGIGTKLTFKVTNLGPLINFMTKLKRRTG